jgi:hypothetical protein
MSVTSGQAAGYAGRLSCRACGEHPVPAFSGDVIRARARSASRVPAASRQTGTLTRCLPASRAGEPLTLCCAQPCGSLV